MLAVEFTINELDQKFLDFIITILIALGNMLLNKLKSVPSFCFFQEHHPVVQKTLSEYQNQYHDFTAQDIL